MQRAQTPCLGSGSHRFAQTVQSKLNTAACGCSRSPMGQNMCVERWHAHLRRQRVAVQCMWVVSLWT